MNSRQRRQRARRRVRGIGFGETLAEMVRGRPKPPPARPQLAIVEAPPLEGFDAFLPEAPARDSAWPEPLPQVLSPTSVTTFLTCPEQWRRVYLQGERSRCSSALLIGRVDSTAREKDLGQKITTGVNMPVDVVEDIAADAYETEVDKEGGLQEILFDPGEKPGDVKDQSIAVARAYRTQRSEGVLPLAVEERVEYEIPGHPVRMSGYLDVREQRVVREAKTSNKAMTKPRAAWNIQTLLYAAGKQLPVTYDVTVKGKIVKVLPPLAGPGLMPELALDAAGKKLEVTTTTVAEGIVGLLHHRGPDERWPGTGAVQMVPPCGWCDFASSCPFAP